MKPSHNGGKKIGKKGPISAGHSHLSFRPRKIPQKSRGSRRDEERICGKERKRDAANLEEAEEVE